jgi:hypothetical protein
MPAHLLQHPALPLLLLLVLLGLLLLLLGCIMALLAAPMAAGAEHKQWRQQAVRQQACKKYQKLTADTPKTQTILITTLCCMW